MNLEISIAENTDIVLDDHLEARIREAVAGDRAALEEVLRAVERRVYLLAWRLIGNAAAAEDISQEVLLKLAQKLPGYRSGTNLWGWIYRIVVNQTHDFRRNLKKIPEIPPPPPSACQDREERLARVESALALLTPREREAVILLDVEGYTSHEAASITGTLAVTLRTRAAGARKKLRLQLSRYYPELRE